MDDRSRHLVGSWRLISWELEFQADGRREPYLGGHPDGWLTFTADGRATTFIAAKDRRPGTSDTEHAALYRSMLAYTGPYRVDGDRLCIDVDGSWNQAWNGTTQERFVAMDGPRLIIVAAWAPHPVAPGAPMVRGWLTWERSS